ncbi:MAG TPA: hypothetical protein VGE06_10120, partial [Flavisolibacter sp.]
MLTVDFFLLFESPRFLCALILLTSEFFTPSLFFRLLPFFVADFFEAAFFVAVFFTEVFLTAGRRVVDFLAVAFFVVPFLVAGFRAVLFLAEAFFDAPFLAVVFFFVAVAIAFLQCAASRVPKKALFMVPGKIISSFTQKKRNHGAVGSLQSTLFQIGLPPGTVQRFAFNDNRLARRWQDQRYGIFFGSKQQSLYWFRPGMKGQVECTPVYGQQAGCF